ncbi:phage holin family protein [Luteolibacter sp. SL250]|uniref:phage holin family protein n=1 Tax=Luteolibacter sp. SL250 TaxID=2995170 RepID=UPI002271008C|nr:phage holin family protein [Luteolibacter sp. SL250]WAC21284.1 phage holin family protein [Luteolibacter sp. SL250]
MPPNWRTALADLVGSRIALVQLEFQQAAGSGLKRGILFAAAAILLLLAWIVLVAGGIGAISASAGWPWYWVTLSAGGIHLFIALILILIARKPGPATFEFTRAEFKKDREWLANFQSPNKSND